MKILLSLVCISYLVTGNSQCKTFGLQVLGQTQDHRHRVLVAAAKNIKNWFVKVRKIKAIYHTLNLFNLDVTQKCLIAECWVPVLDIETIQLALRRGTVISRLICSYPLDRLVVE